MYRKETNKSWLKTVWGIVITTYTISAIQDALVALGVWFIWHFIFPLSVPNLFVIFLLLTSIRYTAIWVRQLILGK